VGAKSLKEQADGMSDGKGRLVRISRARAAVTDGSSTLRSWAGYGSPGIAPEEHTQAAAKLQPLVRKAG